MAIALGLFLATLATLAPPVAAVHISQPVHAPGTVSVVLHFDEPDDIPLTHVLLHFRCDATGAPGFTDAHDLVDGDSTAYATLHISPLSDATQGYGYIQGNQTGYGFHGGEHGYATGDTSAVGSGYGYGYGYTSGDLVLLIDLHAGAFAAFEECTLVVGIDAPGLAGDFESPRSDPFQPRLPPTADANPGPGHVINVPEGSLTPVTLDGTESSDPDGKPDPLAFAWVQDDGPAVTLSPDATSSVVTFPAPSTGQDQDLNFTLTVDDGLDDASDQVTVHVHHDDVAPVADAGPDQVANESTQASPTVVTLDGTGSSDFEGDPLTYLWTQVSGPAVTLDNDAAAKPKFTVPSNLDGGDKDAVFRLNVTDHLLFDVDEVTVHLHKRPVAVLEVVSEELEGRAPHTVHFSVNATCFAPGCSPLLAFDDNDTFTTDIATGSTQTVNHEYAEAGTYTPLLQVVDGRGLAAPPASVTLTVLDAGTPYANAGPDQAVYVGDDVTLDGRASYDPDGGNLTFAWTQTAGEEVELSDASDAQPTFAAPDVAGTLTFQLTVTDVQGLHDADSVTVTVHGAPSGGLSETYFLHAPGCLVGGQALALGSVPPLADHGAHASHDNDGTGSPLLVDGTTVETDHLCLQPADGVTSKLPVDPLNLLDGQDDFPSEDATFYAYAQGSSVDGTLGLSLLLPDSLDPVPVGDDATLDVTLLDGSGHVLGAKTGIHVNYDEPAFGLAAGLADGTVGADYKAVPFHFVLTQGSLGAGAGLRLSVVVHSDLVNVFLEDGHDSSFTLTQADPQPNHAPTAQIHGLATVAAGDGVHLTGDVGDVDAGDLGAVGYDWYQVGGPHVDLTDVHSSALSFQAPDVDQNTTYRFALQARTGTGAAQLTSAPAEFGVKVVAVPGGDGGEGDGNNSAPVARYVGSALVVDEGAAVVLNGVAFDPDQEAVTTEWSQVRAAGDPAVTVTQLPGADGSFTAPQVNGDRHLTFVLTATDPHGATGTDTTVVTVRDRGSSTTTTSTTTTTTGSGSGNNGGTDGSGNPSGGTTGNNNGGNTGSNTGSTDGSSSSHSSTTGGLPVPGVPSANGLLGFDLSATLRVTRIGNVNHLEWDSPGFEPMGYQLWSSNSPYVLLAINDGNRTTYDDATGNQDTLYKVTYFTGMTEAQGFFGDASKVFDWPEAQHHAARKSHIPGLDAGLVALGLLGAAMAVAVRRRL